MKGTLSANTHRQRLRTLRAFFERIIDWDWADGRPATPSLAVTSPKPEPLPKFLDDCDAARLLTAARACPPGPGGDRPHGCL
jgi:site-specific recombinase XerD